jgi:hypothetical protein
MTFHPFKLLHMFHNILRLALHFYVYFQMDDNESIYNIYIKYCMIPLTL